MSAYDRFRHVLAATWRWTRAPFWLGLGFAVGFGVPYGIYLDRMVRERFAELTFAEPSRVYARALRLAPKVPLTADMLRLELAAARYREDADALRPGTYRVVQGAFEISARAFVGARGAQPARRLRVTLAQGRVASLTDADSRQAVLEAYLDPARIATLYGPTQEERRVVRVGDVPPLLIATLQAVEDRDFKHHIGIDPWAIARAMWVNLSKGEVVQGGSTLTQQLVRNLFLDRSQRLVRKLNEAAIALIIEARFSKQRILEAYLNEVYLGQQGAQAVHGVAAASEFYFGHDMSALSVAETALLIGMIQGPSLHDPRRYPERALARRDVVLKVMQEVGLINAVDRGVASKSALGVTSAGALPRNRYPAFLDLVRAELRRDFADSAVLGGGLSIHTTLAPAAQQYAEAALAERIKAMGKAGNDLQGAVVLSHTGTGAVEAVVGGRQGDAQGFNRALAARRPIGSLVKPFVYLVALAQPQEWSLMSTLSDRALSLRLPNGQTWTPGNIDGLEHGDVALIDALARSYNLATVQLGLALDVRKVARVLEALIPGTRIEPNPSLLLGATDLAPFQVAQAYQYLAADGRPMALFGLDAVLDAEGRPITRHGAAPTPGDLVAASRLIGFALQETARHGTAHALVGLGLGHLNAAGKTGTSNEQRDSWFAGYTGTHLAVVWLGTDDNRKTNLFGATGALRVWAGLFGKLPTEPLRLDFSENPQLAWVDAAAQAQTEETCDGARQLPFMAGHAPTEFENCRMQHFSDWFDGREDLAHNTQEPEPDAMEDEYSARLRAAESERQALLRAERERERELARERRRERWRRWFGRNDDET